MDDIDFTLYTDEELTQRRMYYQHKADGCLEAAAAYQETSEGFQKEIEHRSVEAFWIAHSGLRLNAGDELLVTSEFNTGDPFLAAILRESPSDDILPTVRIKTINITSATVEVKFLGMGKATVALDIARKMREAYLQTQAASGSNI